MRAADLVPELSMTVMRPPPTASATTWLFVRTYPSARMTKPLPVPPSSPAAVSMDTTAGVTAFAIPAMVSLARGERSPGACGRDAVTGVVEPREARA